MTRLHVALSAIGIVLALGAVGCLGAPLGEDEVEVASPELRSRGYTTRTTCTSCGCVASDVACDCGTPPRDYKLCCLDQDGDRTGCGYPSRTSSTSSASSSSAGSYSQ